MKPHPLAYVNKLTAGTTNHLANHMPSYETKKGLCRDAVIRADYMSAKLIQFKFDSVDSATDGICLSHTLAQLPETMATPWPVKYARVYVATCY